MDRELLETQLAELPLYVYTYIDPKSLDFTERVRYICQAECPMYGKTWACPPAVGEVAQCKAKCLSYDHCLLVGTITEVDIDGEDVRVVRLGFGDYLAEKTGVHGVD